MNTDSTVDPVVNTDLPATDNSEVVANTSIKMKKQYDHATKSYVMVPKNQPLKVLVSKPRTSKRWVVRYIKANFHKVNFLDVETKTKRIAKRRRQNRIAAAMKWANYHLENR